jgi:hypothetical protein
LLNPREHDSLGTAELWEATCAGRARFESGEENASIQFPVSALPLDQRELGMVALAELATISGDQWTHRWKQLR